MLLKNKAREFIYIFFFILGKLLYPLRVLYNNYLTRIVEYIYTGCLSLSIKISYGSVIRYPSIRIEGPGIIIGRNSYIGKNAVITTWRTKSYEEPRLLIGNGTNIGQNCHITAIDKIEIGNNVLTGKYVTITDNSHGSISEKDLQSNPNKRELISKGPVIIEDNVWIGDKVTICPNVRIGKGSVIGANSVVTKDVPSFSVIVGNPARIIKSFG
jgi:acetyltransferase-like isoleucine patch superfamily enzyme